MMVENATFSSGEGGVFLCQGCRKQVLALVTEDGRFHAQSGGVCRSWYVRLRGRGGGRCWRRDYRIARAFRNKNIVGAVDYSFRAYLCGVDVLTGLLVGIGAGIFATWFPGMLNMQAVSTACRAGRPAAYRFAVGMSLVFPLHAAISMFFTGFLTDRPWIMRGVEEWAALLLLLIGSVFLFKGFTARAARKTDTVRPYRGGPLRRGFGASMLNILNIPFFVAIGSWLISRGYLPDLLRPKLVYTVGVGGGALGVFSVYARLSDWFTRHAAVFTRNINFVIGGLLLLLACFQFLRT